MNDKFIKKTELCFNVNELDAGLQSILENSIAKHTLENINQLSFCGDTYEDGLYNKNAYKLSRHEVRNESKFTELNQDFKNTIWEKIWQEVKAFSQYPVCRMTLRKMKPGSSLIFHKDYSIRWHLVIKTNPFAFMTYLDRDNNTFLSYHIPKDGYMYFTDTTFWHTAVNSGSEDRYAIIISTYEN